MNKFILVIIVCCSQIFAQVQKIVPEIKQENANFGWAIDIDGNWAVISATNEDANDKTSSGRIYIYQKDESSWSFHSSITSDDLDPFDNFGHSIAINNGYIVVGSVGNFEKGPFSGALYVYKLENEVWRFETKLSPSDGGPANFFGQSADIVNNLIVVGAHYGTGNSSKTGTVYLFRKENNEWVEEAKLVASDGEENDLFGFSIAAQDDETIVVGAPKADGNDVNSGAVYIFDKQNEEWEETNKLFANDGFQDELFGYSVDIHNNKIATGAYLKQNNDFNTGEVYVYKYGNDLWALEEIISDDETSLNSLFGINVSLHNDYLAIGASKEDGFNVENVGAVSLYKFGESEWTLQQKYFAEDGGNDDYFGFSVKIDSTQILAGAKLHDSEESNNGAVYSFQHDFVTSVEDEIPLEFQLHQNYPNPLNPSTTIKYDLPVSGNVILKIYDALGREIKTLVDKFEDAGRKEVIWNGTNNFGKNVSSGIYFYRITANENVNVKKMILLK